MEQQTAGSTRTLSEFDSRHRLEAAGVPNLEKPDVQQFLDNMTYDR